MDSEWKCRCSPVSPPHISYSVRSVRSLRMSWALADWSKWQIIHCSTKMTHLWTSQTSSGWVTSSVWPCPDPSTSVLRISGCEALERTVRDTHRRNSGVFVWSVLLNYSSSPIKGTFFLLHSVPLVFLLGAICHHSFFKDETWFCFLFIFFLRGFWVKQINSVQGCLGCTHKNLRSLSAVTEFIPKMMKELSHHVWTWNSSCSSAWPSSSDMMFAAWQPNPVLYITHIQFTISNL